MIEKDHVAGLFAPEIVTVLAHLFHDIPVAHRGPYEVPAQAAQGHLEPQIAHDCCNNCFIFQLVALDIMLCANSHHLVAIEYLALLIGQHYPICIPVKGKTGVGALLPDNRGHVFGEKSAAIPVYIFSVGPVACKQHLGAEFFENRRRNPVRGPVRAIDDDFEPLQGKVSRKGILQIDDIASLSVIDTPRPAYFRCRGLGQPFYFAIEDKFFDVILGLVGKFETVACEISLCRYTRMDYAKRK